MKPLSDLATISIRSHIYLPMFANVSDSYIHNVIFFSTTILQQISLGAKKFWNIQDLTQVLTNSNQQIQQLNCIHMILTSTDFALQYFDTF